MKTRFALCVTLALVTCVSAVGQQVSVNYNHNANFTQYHTYALGLEQHQ